MYEKCCQLFFSPVSSQRTMSGFFFPVVTNYQDTFQLLSFNTKVKGNEDSACLPKIRLCTKGLFVCDPF